MINRGTEAGWRFPGASQPIQIHPGRWESGHLALLARLLKGLLDNCPGARLFAVGDDWQAIFRFAGSDIAVMQEFGKRFGDYERIDLETTFRCSDHIAEVATEFVLRNPAQISKTVRARNKTERPAVQIGLPSDNGLSLLERSTDRIARMPRRHKELRSAAVGPIQASSTSPYGSAEIAISGTALFLEDHSWLQGP